jgi:ADP-ribose pyrophosphatase YjhB (NUDIX family)
MSMPQSYKVFIGSSFISFGNEATETAFEFADPSTEKLNEIILALEEGSQESYLIKGNTDENWNRFRSCYKWIEAAGGMVKNGNGKWLFIYRNNVWDLPKGKLEKDETIEKCAVREVAEECGIEEPEILQPIAPTYHTYSLKGTRILKMTHWFLMESADTSELIPQTEEGITAVIWVNTAEAKKLSKNSFGSIREVVKQGLSCV